MITDLISKEFSESLERGKRFFLKYDYFRILAHYDGDGTSASIILTKLLVCNGSGYHERKQI